MTESKIAPLALGKGRGEDPHLIADPAFPTHLKKGGGKQHLQRRGKGRVHRRLLKRTMSHIFKKRGKRKRGRIRLPLVPIFGGKTGKEKENTTLLRLLQGGEEKKLLSW